jgi:hypothetical protein
MPRRRSCSTSRPHPGRPSPGEVRPTGVWPMTQPDTARLRRRLDMSHSRAVRRAARRCRHQTQHPEPKSTMRTMNSRAGPLSLDNDAPDVRPIELFEAGRIVENSRSRWSPSSLRPPRGVVPHSAEPPTTTNARHPTRFSRRPSAVSRRILRCRGGANSRLPTSRSHQADDSGARQTSRKGRRASRTRLWRRAGVRCRAERRSKASIARWAARGPAARGVARGAITARIPAPPRPAPLPRRASPRRGRR